MVDRCNTEKNLDKSNIKILIVRFQRIRIRIYKYDVRQVQANFGE